MLFSCSKAQRNASPSGHGETPPQTSASNQRPTIVGTPIPPNHGRIIGSIISIDESFLSSDASDPCSKVPCRATVRIESILGYGSAFGKPLVQGSEIQVHFRFTLHPTKDLFPELIREYPGLQVSSKFIASVEARQVFDPGIGSSLNYVIYGYELQK